MPRNPLSIVIRNRSVAKALLFIALLLSVLNIVRRIIVSAAGADVSQSPLRFLHLLDMDGEKTIPAYFSMLLLLASAVLLLVIFHVKRRMALPYWKHWLGLAVVFLYLSVDESLSIHEHLIGITQKLTGKDTGVFLLAWVIPFGMLVLLFVLVYVRFLWHLPVRYRWAFVIAGAIYVFGALVMEVIGGYYIQSNGWNLTLHFLLTIEEFCEMLGIIMFIATLLDYIREELPDFAFSLHPLSIKEKAMQSQAKQKVQH